MLKLKKAQIPLLKTLIILLTSTIILIIYLLALHQMQELYVEDKKTRTQIIESKILTHCFSNELGLIEEQNFNQKTFTQCFGEEITGINIKLSLDKKNYYINSKEDFENKAQFCSSSKSNLLCTKLKYPVIIKNNNNEYETQILTLAIIVQ